MSILSKLKGTAEQTAGRSRGAGRGGRAVKPAGRSTGTARTGRRGGKAAAPAAGGLGKLLNSFTKRR